MTLWAPSGSLTVDHHMTMWRSSEASFCTLGQGLAVGWDITSMSVCRGSAWEVEARTRAMTPNLSV